MIDEPINIILKQILGEEKYIKLIETSAHYCEEFKESTINESLEDISPMLNSCCIIILVIGLSKNLNCLDKYVIIFDEKRKGEIKDKDFYGRFKEYINQVEKFKVDMLEKIT